MSIKIIKKNKLYQVDKFFSKILYDKEFGYYNKNISFDKKGDYITSPNISFLFSEIIGIWIVSFWINLNKPKKFNLVELGPGNGTMIKDLIKTFKKFPEFYNSLNIFLYEKSIFLKKKQQLNLADNKIKWLTNFTRKISGKVLFLGNEFFDAIPIRQFRKKNGIFYEKNILVNNKNKIQLKYVKSNRKLSDKILNFQTLKKNTFIEYPAEGLEILKKILKVIEKNKGGILLIDYGYRKTLNKNTLQSVYKHKKNYIYDNLTNADITHLVNFNLLEEFFLKNKLKKVKILSQGEFLKKNGIIERAEIVSKKMVFSEKVDLFYRIKRLTHASEMGKLFKVIFGHNLKIDNIKFL